MIGNETPSPGVLRPLKPIVAVPARDEEERLPLLVAALDNQLRRGELPLTVVILINNSTDSSFETARRLSDRHRNVRLIVARVDFNPQMATVGWARRAAMDRALEMVERLDAALILTTDADATPRPDWVEANLCAAEAGADLISGMIVAEACEEALLGHSLVRRSRMFDSYCHARTRLEALIDPLQYDPWPRHHFEMAGSIAVRADVYASVGGLDPLPYREDLAFVSKVRSAGYRVRHSVKAVVDVSARTIGRVPLGMSTSLARWKVQAERDEPLLVEHPEKTIGRLWKRRELRHATSGKLQQQLQSAGFHDVALPEREQAARAMAIELLARNDFDAGDVPVEAAIDELGRAIARIDMNALNAVAADAS
jgi:hypothetical protein